MSFRPLVPAVLVIGTLAACEQTSQTLPFETGSTEPVVREVPAAGGTISSTAGASIALPAGALPGSTVVTLTPSAASATTSGAAAAGFAFHVEPAGLRLGAPAAVSLTVDRNRTDAWLASAVVQTPAGLQELGEGSVDLTTGIMHGKITTLGTVMATIPEPGAVLRARALSGARTSVAGGGTSGAAVLPPTRALRGDCGTPANRCATLSVEVSPNLLALVDTVAVVYPRVTGEMQISGTTARGALKLHAPLRVRLGSRANAATVPSRITAEATEATVVTETPGQLSLSNVRVIGQSGQQQSEATVTLVVGYEGARAWIRLNHNFEAALGSNGREPVTVAAEIPLVRVQ